MPVDTDQIHELTESIWETMLGLAVARCEVEETATNGDPSMTGCVQITGAWEGAVTLDCSLDFARRAAEIMFDLEPQAADFEEIKDALGELANMLGGNLKSLLPGPAHLSLPAITEGSDYSVTVQGSELVTQTTFKSEGHAVKVALLKKKESK